MRLFLSVTASLLAIGCNHHVYSPPARALPLESVAPVGRDRVGLALEGAGHSELFGPSATSGAGRLRVSPHEDVDVSVEGNVIHIQGKPATDVDQNIYALRLGAKFRAQSWLALTGGLGGGLHAAGTYASPDLGVIAGYENSYAIPYVSFRGFVSEPLAVRAVDTSEAGEAPGTHIGRPRTTGGFSAALGLRIPIVPGFDPNEGVRGALVASPGLTYVGDAEQDSVFVQLGGGAELTF
jgi:hypothetical protein